MKRLALLLVAMVGVLCVARAQPAAVQRDTFLAGFRAQAEITWPKNRALHVVCHGHSVPAGYFKTPDVHTLEAYPHLLRVGLAQRFPHAVINVIVTAIGGENSEQGAARFERDVLSLRPDVVTIDYALNDRRIGLERAEKAWTSMIAAAQARGIPVLLLTPTPDTSHPWQKADDPLQQHAAQIRRLAQQHGVGLVDSLAAFEAAVKQGADAPSLMSQSNHPNGKGHELVGRALLEWFR